MNKHKSLLPSHTLNNITFEDHYSDMKREFAMDYWWVYILNSVVSLSCFVAFFFIDGKELVYTFYIPLDFALNLSKTAFFFYEKREDQIKKVD